MADISEIIRITTDIRGVVSSLEGFGVGLLVTTNDSLSPSGTGKTQSYSSLAEMENVFPAGSAPLAAGSAWFSQNPLPLPLAVTRWIASPVNTRLVGGTPGEVADIDAANASFTVNGNDITVDLSSASSYAEIAAAIQTAIRTQSDPLDDATFAYVDTRFVLTLTSTDSIETEFGQVGSGTDISGLLGMTAATGAQYQQGTDTESVGACLAAAETVLGGYSFVMIDNDVTRSHIGVNLDTAEYVETSKQVFFMSAVGDAVLVQNETTSEAAQVFALGYTRTATTWSRTADYKHVSIAARMSAQDFSNGGAIITPKFRQLPGQAADTLTLSERNELRRKRVNYYIRRGSTAIYEEGWCAADGIWLDSIIWLDWLQSDLETALFNVLVSSPRIPITTTGMATLRQTVNTVLENAVVTGGFGPGQVSPALAAEIRATTMNSEFDGTLTNGYLSYIAPINTRSAAAVAERRAPTIHIWGRGSEAVHFASISLVFRG